MTSLLSDLHKNYQGHEIPVSACILLGNLYCRYTRHYILGKKSHITCKFLLLCFQNSHQSLIRPSRKSFMTHDAYTHWNNGLTSNTGRRKEKKNRRRHSGTENTLCCWEIKKTWKTKNSSKASTLIFRSNYSDNYITWLSLVPVLVVPLLIHIHHYLSSYPTQ